MTGSIAPTAARSTGPSLLKLVSGVPVEQRLHHAADALVIIGHQLELLVQDEHLPADLSFGILRFSLFRLHQGRIAQLRPICRSITVYGEADVEPPVMPGVNFVALQPGSPLCQEWFLVLDSPGFWGALLTQAVPERLGGNMRRYRFDGALSADERVVSRAGLLLSLIQGHSTPAIGARDHLANQARWARVIYELALHPEAERLNLLHGLSDFPELLQTLAQRTQPQEQLLAEAMQTLQRYGTAGEICYCVEGQLLQPVVWSGAHQPPASDMAHGLAGRALQQAAPLLSTLTPADAEQALLPDALSVVAVPVWGPSRPWGVLLVGLREPEPADAPAAQRAVGVAALLEQIFAAQAQPGAASAPTPPKTPAPAPAATNGAAFGQVPPAPAATNGAAFSQVPPAPAATNGAAFSQVPPAPAPAATNGAAFGQVPPAQPATTAVVPSGLGLPTWMRGGLPMVAPAAPAVVSASAMRPAAPDPYQDRSWAMLQKRMMGALVAFDQRSAEQVWQEACSLYATETICTDLLMPVQIAVGEGWHRGEVSVAAEHFTSRFVEGKLLTLLNTYGDSSSGPLAVIGCAQNELHELGAIMLSLFMRWSGFRVIYLGQNVPNTTIAETIRQIRPQVLGLSATTIEAAHSLTEVGQIITRMEPPRPMFIFGGMAFYERPDLRARIAGQFLEGDVRQIVRQLADTLRQKSA